MNKITTLFLTILLTLSAGPLMAKEKTPFSIQSTYTKNSNIWGAYSLQREELHLETNRKKTVKLPSKLGHLMITNGRINIGREIDLSHRESRLHSIDFPHQQTKKLKKVTFTNKKKLKQKKWQSYYDHLLQAELPFKNEQVKNIVYHKYQCTRVGRHTIRCQVDGHIDSVADGLTLNESRP